MINIDDKIQKLYGLNLASFEGKVVLMCILEAINKDMKTGGEYIPPIPMSDVQNLENYLDFLTSRTEENNAIKVSKTGDSMSGSLILNADPTSELMAATKQYVDNQIAISKNDALTFKGFISTTSPFEDVRDGNYWYNSPSTNISFPWSVYIYSSGAWSSDTIEYTPSALDLWSNLNDNHGYYYFGDQWNLLDFSGSTFNQNQFSVIDGAVSLKSGGITNSEIADNAAIDLSKTTFPIGLGGQFLMEDSSSGMPVWSDPLSYSDIENSDTTARTVSGKTLHDALSYATPNAIDNLTSTSTENPLSANMGRELNKYVGIIDAPLTDGGYWDSNLNLVTGTANSYGSIDISPYYSQYVEFRLLSQGVCYCGYRDADGNVTSTFQITSTEKSKTLIIPYGAKTLYYSHNKPVGGDYYIRVRYTLPMPTPTTSTNGIFLYTRPTGFTTWERALTQTDIDNNDSTARIVSGELIKTNLELKQDKLPTGLNNQFLFNSGGNAVWANANLQIDIDAANTTAKTISGNLLKTNLDKKQDKLPTGTSNQFLLFDETGTIVATRTLNSSDINTRSSTGRTINGAILRAQLDKASQNANRNILLNSGEPVTNSTDYQLKTYKTSMDLIEGQSYTIVIKGKTGGTQRFGIWMNQTSSRVGYISVPAEGGTGSLTFVAPAIITGRERDIYVFNYPPNTSAANPASIEWAALYEGDITPALDWIPAPEDLLYKPNPAGDGTKFLADDNTYKTIGGGAGIIVEDSSTSTSTTNAASANQVRLLNESLATLNGSVSTLQQSVSSIVEYQLPKRFDYNGSNVFTLPKNIVDIAEVRLYSPNNAYSFLQDNEYSFSGADVTIAAPLSDGMAVKIFYFA